MKEHNKLHKNTAQRNLHIAYALLDLTGVLNLAHHIHPLYWLTKLKNQVNNKNNKYFKTNFIRVFKDTLSTRLSKQNGRGK